MFSKVILLSILSIMLSTSSARAQDNLSACSALLSHGLRDVVSTDVRQALRQQTFNKLCNDNHSLKEDVSRRVKDYELEIAAAADFTGFGSGSGSFGSKESSDEQKRLMIQSATKFCSESSGSYSQNSSSITQASNINREATAAWIDCIKTLRPNENLRTTLVYHPDNRGFTLGMSIASASMRVTGIIAPSFDCKIVKSDGRLATDKDAQFPIILTNQAVNIDCIRKFKIQNTVHGNLEMAPASQARILLDNGPLAITFRAASIPEYPFVTFESIAAKVVEQERELARLSADLNLANKQIAAAQSELSQIRIKGVDFAKRAERADRSEWSDKSTMLRARDDNHFLRFHLIGPANHDVFELWRTDDHWFDTIGEIRAGTGVGILAARCPEGWKDAGVVGMIMGDSFLGNNPYGLGSANDNKGWTWIHPHLCLR